MINVNGTQYNDYDEAISFLMQEKKRAAEEEADAALTKMTDENMSVIAVKHTTSPELCYLILFSDKENRDVFIEASLERFFGFKYQFKNNHPHKRYDYHILPEVSQELCDKAKRWLRENKKLHASMVLTDKVGGEACTMRYVNYFEEDRPCSDMSDFFGDFFNAFSRLG